MKHRRLLWIMIVLMALAMVACSTSGQVETPPASTESSTAQELPNITQAHLTGPVATATGKVVLAQPVDLSFATAGQVVELTVKEGDVVKAGQVIARLDTTIADSAVDRAEAGLAVLQAELAKVQAGASEAEIREAQSLATAVVYNWSLSPGQRPAEQAAAQARLDYLLAQPFPEDLALARARVSEAETLVAEARAERERSMLVAPVAGEVTQVSVNAYEFVESGQVVVQIGDTSKLRIEATNMTETDIAQIAEGSSAVVMFDALPNVRVPGTVTAILQSEGGLAAFVVVVEVDDFPDGIRPGMTAYVTIALR